MAQGWILPVVLTVLLWGGMVFLPKLAVVSLPPLSAILYEVLGGVTVALLVLAYLKGKIVFDPRGSSMAYLTGVFGFSGTLTYFWAVTKGPVSIISVLSAMYPVVVLLLGYLILHEELTTRQIAGVVLALAGVMLVSK